MLEEESFNPDRNQGGDDGCSDDLQRLQVCAVCVDLTPALLQVQEDHLLIHLQGTLHVQTHTFNKSGAHRRVSGGEILSCHAISQKETPR